MALYFTNLKAQLVNKSLEPSPTNSSARLINKKQIINLAVKVRIPEADWPGSVHKSCDRFWMSRFGSESEQRPAARNAHNTNTVEIVYNDIGYNDEPDITTEL